MKTRRGSVSKDSDEQRSNKRQRTDDARGETPSPAAACSLDDVNNDCLRLILSYVSDTDDLNSFAICSKSCRQARADPSLDQTRTGTIVLSDESTFDSLCGAIIRGRWNRYFRENQTKLKIVGLEKLPAVQPSSGRHSNAYLNRVTSLQFSCDRTHPFSTNALCIFCGLLPNLTELDMGDMVTIFNSRTLLRAIARYCPKLQRFTWKDCQTPFAPNGYAFASFEHLTELCLDGAQFDVAIEIVAGDDDDTADDWEPYLLSFCQHLERVSIQNCSWNEWYGITPMSNEIVCKMVRHHEPLRWLRSDLSVEDVAILREDRPDITFVSE